MVLVVTFGVVVVDIVIVALVLVADGMIDLVDVVGVMAMAGPTAVEDFGVEAALGSGNSALGLGGSALVLGEAAAFG